MTEKDEKEKNAKNLRGRAKSSLTRIYNFINNEQVFEKHDLINKLEKIETIYMEFDKADACLPEELSEMAEFEEKYYETKAKLQQELEKINISIQSNTNNEQSNIVTSSNNFKLPKINIQVFRGNFKDWMSFKDLYISLVHDNKSLTNIQKFQYLRGLLADEAASIIKHIPISENSYLEAWEKLLSRYDRKKQIVSSLIKTFMEQSSMSHANIYQLRKIADTSDEIIRGLKSIDTKANERDIWLIYILLQKVDLKTREEWAQFSAKHEFPTFDMFIQFLNDKCASLELYNQNESNVNKEKRTTLQKFSSDKPVYNNFKCALCKLNHFLYKCSKFKELNVKDRKQFIRKRNLCENCFSSRHDSSHCASNFRCHFCKSLHHSLLCENQLQNYVAATSASNENLKDDKKIVADIESSDKNRTQKGALICNVQTSLALLPTANVFVFDITGKKHKLRVMFDSGSEATFVSESCINLLGFNRKNARFPVKGLSDSKIAVTKGYVNIELISIHDADVKLSVKAYILEKLTSVLPSEEINKVHLSHFKNLQLADPCFQIPNKIDMIIGSDYFFSILLPGKIDCNENNLIAQNSILGFLVGGKLPEHYSKSESISNLHIYENNIDLELRRFWELEEVFDSNKKFLSPEEQFVENHFRENYSINENGRFVVKLPFYKSKSELGDSKRAAISRLYAMERKFKENSEFEKQYKDFMYEYVNLGHMELVTENCVTISQNEQYFLPHHAVIKPSSCTTKLRVVFDASCKTSSGKSLNSILGVGPKLQRDIFEILLNFRFPEIVFSADIEKMYRQILISDEDQNYQKILWRFNANEEIRTYKLKTVTYGLAPASFLATRCVQQVALDYTGNPTVSRVLQEDIYMDDLLSGSDTVSNAISICKEISNLLETHGFHLRKWNSNSQTFLSEFKEHCSTDNNFEIAPNNLEGSKVLGLFWNSNSDTFNFQTALQLTPPLTKRHILSQCARIFDPLGLISPCTVMLKIFYQKLWLTKGDWDSPIPQHLAIDLLNFQESFNEIKKFSIPRCVTINTNCAFELHGFADASTLAYAAVIYCRQTYDHKTSVSLLVSKTKVAPIKQISVPKLELCAAHLLSKLFSSVMNILKNYKFEIYAWTDSKVALSWLSAHPRKWKTFVANRTSQIIDVLPTKHWRHVPSKDNPADIASRGVDPKCLPDNSLWWNGPQWLHLDSSHWPKEESNTKEIEDKIKSEQKPDPIFSFHNISSNELFDDLFKKYSSFSKITRILAYCLRFIKNSKRIHKVTTPADNSFSPLTFAETKNAEEIIIRWVQKNYFPDDLKCINNKTSLSGKSQLHSLNPFLDENGLLRVGGRLHNSQLSFNQKHPIILPSKHKLSELIIREKHVTHLHAGPSLLSHIIKQSYWIIGGKKLINKLVNKCITCFKFKTSTTTSQLMGNLPTHRVTLERPFLSCGVDYAGPITVKFNKGRGSKSTKGYIALFICFATKAVHIEAVSDLTTDAFIAAFRRFSARRGSPRHVYSDNAKNFVGANRKFKAIQQLWSSFPKNEILSNFLTQSSIEWHFIPPASPHFGGIWEAAIRSAKYHMKRIIGQTLLTFEELTTLLTQIEALLNSRPLYTVNDSDVDSITVITPSHFLTGDSLLSTPDVPSASHYSLRARWDLLQKLRLDFCRAWKKQYLSSLQPRKKWKDSQPNIKKDDIVLIKESESFPGFWPMGRVIDVHPGADQLVRVATIKTKDTVLKRNIHNLIKIPLYQD